MQTQEISSTVAEGLDLAYIDNVIFHGPDAERFVMDNGVKLPSIPVSFTTFQVVDDGRKPTKISLLNPIEERSLFLQYNYCRMRVSQYVNIGGKKPSASIKREIHRWSRRAFVIRSVIAERNMPQVIELVQRFSRSGIDEDERVSEGQDVLLKSIDRFDVDRTSDGDRTFSKLGKGNRFTTYLWWGLTKRFQKIATRAKHMTSIEACMEANGRQEFCDWKKGKKDRSTDIAMETLSEILEKNLAGLTDMEMVIIKARFYREEKPSMDTVAKGLNVLKSVVNEAEKRAFRKLKNVLMGLL